jgi:hypothetical protein
MTKCVGLVLSSLRVVATGTSLSRFCMTTTTRARICFVTTEAFGLRAARTRLNQSASHNLRDRKQDSKQCFGDSCSHGTSHFRVEVCEDSIVVIGRIVDGASGNMYNAANHLTRPVPLLSVIIFPGGTRNTTYHRGQGLAGHGVTNSHRRFRPPGFHYHHDLHLNDHHDHVRRVLYPRLQVLRSFLRQREPSTCRCIADNRIRLCSHSNQRRKVKKLER